LGCFCWGLVRAFMLLRYCLEFLVFLIFVFWVLNLIYFFDFIYYTFFGWGLRF
jgi:hypothetical protein